MSAVRTLGWIVALGVAWSCGAVAEAQEVQLSATNDRSTPALKYFGRGTSLSIPKPTTRRPAPVVRPFSLTTSKPFEHIHGGPTVTPYLSLDAVETSVGIPNYYSRVLPQLQQQRANEAQTANLRRLQQQVRLANAPGLNISSQTGGVPTTGHSTQFLNSGGYFPTAQQ